MKKIITLAAFLLAAVAHAEYYLYWEFDQTGLSNQIEFKYAKIQVADAGGASIGDPAIYLTFDSDGDIEFKELRHDSYRPEQKQGTTIGPNYVELGEYATSAYSFILELYSTQNEQIGISEFVSFSDLKEFGHVYENMATTGKTPYNFTVNAVPEPTGGMLVLLGLGALALRRKKA